MLAEILDILANYEPIFSLLIGVFAALLATAIAFRLPKFMLSYLERERDYARPALDADLFRKVEEIEKKSSPTEAERKEIVSLLQKNIEAAATEKFLDQIRKELHDQDPTKSKLYELQLYERATVARLRDEIRNLGRRGNLNLVIGMLLAMTGIAVLIYLVVIADVGNTETRADYVVFFSRISIAIVIQFFSYFFLRLYRTTLSEIRYFQNELTTVEFRFAALRLACIELSPRELSAILRLVIENERNFVLEKGQSTVSIEKERLSSTVDQAIPSQLTALFRNSNKQP